MANRPLHPLLHYLRRLSAGKNGDGALDDAQLLHRFLNQRDESAFTILVQRYGAMVWSLCVRRLGETPEAEDAFQATFLVLVRKAASLHGPQLLGPWLYGVAYRTAMKLRGQRARRKARELPLPEQLAEPRSEQMGNELRPILDEEIQRLPTKYRLPVLLCYLQGLSCEEAAQRLGCAKGTIFSRLARARDLLRRRLLRRGLDLSAGMLAVVLAENAVVRAALPAALGEMTVRTSLLFAAGTAGQTLSASLAALVEGVVRNMFFSKVKFAALVVLAVGLVGSGAGFVVHRGKAEQPEKKPAVKTGAAASLPKDFGKRKTKEDAARANQPPPSVSEAKQRLLPLRELLMLSIKFEGVEDPQVTLIEFLDQISKRYNLRFSINEEAFEKDEVKETSKLKIADRKPIPQISSTLSTVLHMILRRVPTPSGATYLIRHDRIEITTGAAVRRELGIPEPLPLLPLISDAFKEMPLAKILPRLAEMSDYNVVGDPRAKDKLQTEITAQLNNVPIDTAVRLLANMAGLTVVRLDNVFYVTTEENAKHLRVERARLNAEEMAGTAGPQPATAKPVK